MNFKHGDARAGRVERLHRTWRKMQERCNPALAARHPRYAGRGITVCAEWRDYLTFKAWALANGYADHLTIERIENDGDYEPSNCRWITRGDQTRNRSSSRRLTCEGRTQLLQQWADETGLSASLISHRLTAGWPVERALSERPRASR